MAGYAYFFAFITDKNVAFQHGFCWTIFQPSYESSATSTKSITYSSVNVSESVLSFLNVRTNHFKSLNELSKTVLLIFAINTNFQAT
jgi:hypothetical protein